MGVLLYVMLTGGLPFDDPSFVKLKQQIQMGQYQNRISIPAGACAVLLSSDPCFALNAVECESLIRGMLDPNPETRFTIPDIKNHEWIALDYSLAAEIRASEDEDYRENEFLSELIYATMRWLGYKRSNIEHALCARTFDATFATYHMLLDALRHTASDQEACRAMAD